MIDINEHYLKQAKTKWERFKINWGLESLPADYACCTIQEFLSDKGKMQRNDLIILPKLTYYPEFIDDPRLGEKIKVELGDETGRIYVKVRPTAFNPREGEILTDTILRLRRGDTMYFPLIRNGFSLPGTLIQPEFIDDSFYLCGFDEFKIKKRGKSNSATSISSEFGAVQAVLT